MDSNINYDTCDLCEGPIVRPFTVDRNGLDGTYCSETCGVKAVEEHEEKENRRAERAYESFLDDYYGGSSAVTVDEMHVAAWKEKQELRRGR